MEETNDQCQLVYWEHMVDDIHMFKCLTHGNEYSFREIDDRFLDIYVEKGKTVMKHSASGRCFVMIGNITEERFLMANN